MIERGGLAHAAAAISVTISPAAIANEIPNRTWLRP
jgi:hypothetical protein